MKKYYDLLGLKETASYEDVESAYNLQKSAWESKLSSKNDNIKQRAQDKIKELDGALNEIKKLISNVDGEGVVEEEYACDVSSRLGSEKLIVTDGFLQSELQPQHQTQPEPQPQHHPQPQPQPEPQPQPQPEPQPQYQQTPTVQQVTHATSVKPVYQNTQPQDYNQNNTESDDNGNGSSLIKFFLVAVLVGLGGYMLFGKSDKPNMRAEKPTSPPIKNESNTYNKGSFTTPGSPTVPKIYMGAIAGAYESSSDKEGNYVHSAKLTIDDNLSTCWSEGVNGAGFGENIVFQFNGTYEVSGFEIWIGHQKSNTLFYNNSRPKVLVVEDSNGRRERVHLSDYMGSQRVQFNSPMKTNSLRLIIDDVYYGNKWQDTCIAEIKFF